MHYLHGYLSECTSGTVALFVYILMQSVTCELVHGQAFTSFDNSNTVDSNKQALVVATAMERAI